jgi:hypothetical protein
MLLNKALGNKPLPYEVDVKSTAKYLKELVPPSNASRMIN